MKPNRQRTLALCFALNVSLVFAALGSLLALPAAAVTLGFEPASQSLELGEVAEIDLVFSDLGGEIISAYDLDLTYDPSIVDATGVAFSTALGDEFFFEVFNDFDLSSPGVVDLAQLSLLSDSDLAAIQTGDTVRVATLTFEAVGTGSTALGFVFDEFNDVKGSSARVLEIVPQGGSIRVPDSTNAPVPEPTAALVFAAGVLVVRAAVQRRGAVGGEAPVTAR